MAGNCGEEATLARYIAKDGTRVNEKRGTTNAALDACLSLWLLLVMQPNTVERHRMYI